MADAAEPGIFLGKTREELAKLYAPGAPVPIGEKIAFDVSVAGVPCKLLYGFSREHSSSVQCFISPKGVQQEADALARWNKVLKALLGDRQPTTVELKLDGVQLLGADAHMTPNLIVLAGNWDDTHPFRALFGGPNPQSVHRDEVYDMLFFVHAKLPPLSF